MQKLLTESFPFIIEKVSLTESKEGGKRMVARGQFGKCDVPTANNRIYKRHLWEREIKKLMPRIKDNQVFGELDHPGDGSTKLQRVSHIITNVNIRPDGIIEGEAVIMPKTANGQQLLAILEGGGKVGISSRGFGSTVNENGMDVVQDDFQLLTWDFVADPAAAGSYPEFQTESKKISGEEIKEESSMKPKVEIQEQFVEKKQDKKEDEQNKKEETKEEMKDKNSQESQNEKAQDKGQDEDLGKEKSLEADLATISPEVVKKIKEDAYREAVAKIQEMLKEREEALREQIRGECMSDPKVAGASTTLENVKKLLVPHLVDGDIKQEMEKRDKEILGLKEQLAKAIEKNKDLESKIQEQESKMKKHLGAIKELGYNLKAEKAMEAANIFDPSKKLYVRKRIGDVCKYESIEQLDEVLMEVLSQVEKDNIQLEESFKNKIREQNKIIIEQEEKIKALKNQILKSEEVAANTIELAERMSARAYLSERVVGHPAADRIKRIVEARNLTKKEDIDAICEQFSQLRTPGSILREKIKNSYKQEGYSASTLVEDQIKKTFPSDGGEEEIIEGTGITINNIKQLS